MVRNASLAAAVLLCAAQARSTPVAQVVDPRPAHHVLDATEVLSEADVRDIDESAARAAPNGELLVVVVPSTDGVASRAWATAVFNRLRVDTQARSRGVLLVAALDDRAAEIVLGDGYPLATAAQTDAIMNDVVVPRFRAGSPQRAIVDGARSIVDRVVLRASVDAPPTPARARPALTPAPAASTRSDGDAGWLLGAGGVVLAAGVALFRAWRGPGPRHCPRCKKVLTRLDEFADDEHLSSAERAEEDVGSADYEVWRCDGCGLIEKSRHAAWLPSHGACPSCGARTWGTESSRTLEAATHVSTGRVEVTEACAHCNHRATSTVVTPKRRARRGGGSRGASSGDRGGTSSGAGSSGTW